MYHYYRVLLRTKKPNGRDTGKVEDHIKRMKVAMNELRFYGRHPILVFNFSTRLVTEADTLEVNDAQAFIALLHFLSGFGLEQCRTICGSLTADEDGVTC